MPKVSPEWAQHAPMLLHAPHKGSVQSSVRAWIPLPWPTLGNQGALNIWHHTQWLSRDPAIPCAFLCSYRVPTVSAHRLTQSQVADDLLPPTSLSFPRRGRDIPRACCLRVLCIDSLSPRTWMSWEAGGTSQSYVGTQPPINSPCQTQTQL